MGTNVPVVVEVRDLDEVRAALEVGGVDRLLLDNFSPAQAAEAVAFIAGRIPTEASGGLTPIRFGRTVRPVWTLCPSVG